MDRGQAFTLEGFVAALGALLREVWALHQQLDPHCSNPAVDAIFRVVDDLAAGYKLAGAGGGGFMIFYCPLMSRNNVIQALHEKYGGQAKRYDYVVEGLKTWSLNGK